MTTILKQDYTIFCYYYSNVCVFIMEVCFGLCLYQLLPQQRKTGILEKLILHSILTLTTLEHPSFCLKHPLPVNTLSLHVQNRCLNFMIIYVSLHACHTVYTYTFFLTMLRRPVSISVSIPTHYL